MNPYSWKNYEIEHTSDENLIKSVLEHNYDNLVFDGSPSLKNFNVHEGIWFLLRFKQELAGFITFKCLNNILWSPHVLIFKQFRGKGSEYWGRQTIGFMRNHFGAKKFLAFTPYIMAKRYAEKVGFKQIAVLTNSIQKNSKLLNQYVLEI